MAGNRYDDGYPRAQGRLLLGILWSNLGCRMTGGALLTDDKLSGVSTPSNGTHVFMPKTLPRLAKRHGNGNG